MTDLLLIGEAWGEHEARKGRPFVGPAGEMLNAFLAAHGIDRYKECYLTNVFNFQPQFNKIESLCGRKEDGIPGWPSLRKGLYVRREFADEIARLHQECRNINPNLIVPLGNTACWAMFHASPSIKKWRGAPMMTTTGHKALPTYHPSAILRNFSLRPIVFSDFAKIRRESAFPEIRRPEREFWLHPTLEDLHDFDTQIRSAKKLSVDIETKDRQITCIGFAPRHDLALVIPFYARSRKDGNYWPTLGEEMEAWSWVRKWCTSPIPKIGQNILYDARYLWQIYGIPLMNIEGDTMLIHHALQPELEKNLGFLGTMHTEEPSWKFMRKDIKTLKKED